MPYTHYANSFLQLILNRLPMDGHVIVMVMLSEIHAPGRVSSVITRTLTILRH